MRYQFQIIMEYGPHLTFSQRYVVTAKSSLLSEASNVVESSGSDSSLSGPASAVGGKLFSVKKRTNNPSVITARYLPESTKTKTKTNQHVLNSLLVVDETVGVSWPSGLAYRTQVLVLAAECGFESRPWHLCPWARHLTIIASLHPGVKWVPVRAELVD